MGNSCQQSTAVDGDMDGVDPKSSLEDGRGEIDRDEGMPRGGRGGGRNRCSVNSMGMILQVFNTFDTDEAGSVDLPKLRAALVALKVTNASELAEKMIQEADHDKDGVLNFEEFLDAVSTIMYGTPEADKIVPFSYVRVNDLQTKEQWAELVKDSPALAARIRKDKDQLNEVMCMLCVSGTLQEGFPLRANLDLKREDEGKSNVEAILLGNVLIRGVKSYFDIKDNQSRERTKHSRTSLITKQVVPVNPANVYTANPLDANIYATYLVHERAALKALLHEPRDLSIAPDVAEIDINAEETDPGMRTIFNAYMEWKDPSCECRRDVVRAPTVISVCKGLSFVENLPLHVKDDGTRVTDFPNGLAKMAGTKAELMNVPGSDYFMKVANWIEREHKTADYTQNLLQKWADAKDTKIE